MQQQCTIKEFPGASGRRTGLLEGIKTSFTKYLEEKNKKLCEKVDQEDR